MQEFKIHSPLLGIDELITLSMGPQASHVSQHLRGTENQRFDKDITQADTVDIQLLQKVLNYDPAPGTGSGDIGEVNGPQDQDIAPTWTSEPITGGVPEPPAPENMTSVSTETDNNGNEYNVLTCGWDNGGSILVADAPIGYFTELQGEIRLSSETNHVAVGVGDSAHNEYWGVRQTTDSDGNDAWELYGKSAILEKESSAKDYVENEQTAETHIIRPNNNDFDPDNHVVKFQAMCSPAFVRIEFDIPISSSETDGGTQLTIPRDIYRMSGRPDTAFTNPSIQLLTEPDNDSPSDGWEPQFKPIQYTSNIPAFQTGTTQTKTKQ